MRSPRAQQRPQVERWLLARLDGVVRAGRGAWGIYGGPAGVRAIMDFVVDGLSNWFVRVNRPRFWAPDRTAGEAALATLHEALRDASRLLAPAAPFLADWLHRAVAGTAVHLERFPSERGLREPELVGAMDAIRLLASLARAALDARSMRVRQPIARMKVAVPAAVTGPALADLLDILVAEVNAKAVEVVESDHGLVTLRGKANFRSLGKRYGAETPRAAEAVSQLTAQDLLQLERGEVVRAGSLGGRRGDGRVTREVASDWLVQAGGPYVGALDPGLSAELI